MVGVAQYWRSDGHAPHAFTALTTHAAQHSAALAAPTHTEPRPTALGPAPPHRSVAAPPPHTARLPLRPPPLAAPSSRLAASCLHGTTLVSLHLWLCSTLLCCCCCCCCLAYASYTAIATLSSHTTQSFRTSSCRQYVLRYSRYACKCCCTQVDTIRTVTMRVTCLATTAIVLLMCCIISIININLDLVPLFLFNVLCD